MTSQTRSPRYTSVAIALHWAMAGLLIGMIVLGWNMGDLKEALLNGRAMIGAVGYDGPNEAQLQAMGGRVEWMYQLHKSIGITLLMLTIARIVWRVMNPPPPLPAMKGWEARLSHLVHVGFYGLMIAIPLTGWLMVSLPHDFKVPTVIFGVVSWPHMPFTSGLDEALYTVVHFIHGRMSWLIFALLAMHVGGALKHEFSEEDGVLKRMIPGLFGKTDKPARPPRGFVTAFGSALGAFVLVAGLPMAANALQSGGEELQVTGTTGIAPNWIVDEQNSTIEFSGIHDGDEFTASFSNWSAQIFFDPVNLSASDALIEVDMASVMTNKKLYTDSLKAAEWFGVKDWPQASVRVDNFRQADGGYIADATLRLKGNEVTAPLNFTFTRTDDGALVVGEAVFSRTPLDLGQESDPGGDWVSEEVTVTISVEADPSR